MDASLYQRHDNPKRMIVTQRRGAPARVHLSSPEIVCVDSATECHVTPPHVAARMVGYLGDVGEGLTMDPQAGTGNLLRALVDAGYASRDLVAIERHIELCNVIRQRFKDEGSIKPINDCFLGYAKMSAGKIEYPRIITNPPFRKVKQHMDAALSLLGRADRESACLVALVPCTYQHDEAGILEELPRDTFDTSAVSTIIVRFIR